MFQEDNLGSDVKYLYLLKKDNFKVKCRSVSLWDLTFKTNPPTLSSVICSSSM